MTQEEKARAYDKALKKAREWYNDSHITIGLRGNLEDIFPELKESKDNRIMKVIRGWIYTRPASFFDNGISKEEILAWLEKQGKKKLDDEVEPKFHKGEWITNGDYTWKIVEVKPLDYILQSQDGDIVDDTISHVDEHFHSFTIEDAKDGDVLCCESGWTCIFKALNSDNTSFSSYCFMDNTGWFCETGSHTLEKAFIKAYNGEIYPATKEQRNTLFATMKEAGYIWIFSKKELVKIEQNPTKWSDEDERNFQNIDDVLFYDKKLPEDTCIKLRNFLKTLRQRCI